MNIIRLIKIYKVFYLFRKLIFKKISFNNALSWNWGLYDTIYVIFDVYNCIEIIRINHFWNSYQIRCTSIWHNICLRILNKIVCAIQKIFLRAIKYHHVTCKDCAIPLRIISEIFKVLQWIGNKSYWLLSAHVTPFYFIFILLILYKIITYIGYKQNYKMRI